MADPLLRACLSFLHPFFTAKSCAWAAFIPRNAFGLPFQSSQNRFFPVWPSPPFPPACFFISRASRVFFSAFLKRCKMCYEVKCTHCGKRTWQGCGKHIDSVMKPIPVQEQCACKPRSQDEFDKCR
ncbi:hypothetical protein TGVAND_268300 [Toxoplasma gondii VAND]|uniref:Uncharacterized protein n=1 Tax=Toxoplasma gondii VAND TaxID=933077 RepID=A0A086Q0W0_TOXGO|nr:hypothetical protein TGVAND_268300 [Toxoplasma gondii VAND]